MATYQEPSRWTPILVERQIDPILLLDKRLEISQEMQLKSLAARRSAKNDHQRANAELTVVNEWAEKLFSAWIEIWDIQGYPRCHALYRAIFEVELRNLFVTRNACFKGDQQRWALIDRSRAGKSATGGWFKREIDRLCSKWNRRVNVESRKCMYAAKRDKATLTAIQSAGMRLPDRVGAAFNDQGRTAVSTFTWKELAEKFREIQMKPSVRNAVSAVVMQTTWESGSVNEVWMVGGDSVCSKEFEHLASIAARKLGYSLNEIAYKDWLGRVRQYIHQAELDKEKSVVWQPNGDGIRFGLTYKCKTLHTEKIAELSAMFCLDLIARGIPESAVLTMPLEHPEIADDPQWRPTRIERKPYKIKTRLTGELRRRKVIFGAIQAGMKGRKYCSELDSKRLHLSPLWIEEGCPATYFEAYLSQPWRKRIQDEKHRFGKLFRETPKKEREAIIQGDTGTRRTRQ